jgi:hypothetical protein
MYTNVHSLQNAYVAPISIRRTKFKLDKSQVGQILTANDGDMFRQIFAVKNSREPAASRLAMTRRGRGILAENFDLRSKVGRKF